PQMRYPAIPHGGEQLKVPWLPACALKEARDSGPSREDERPAVPCLAAQRPPVGRQLIAHPDYHFQVASLAQGALDERDGVHAAEFHGKHITLDPWSSRIIIASPAVSHSAGLAGHYQFKMANLPVIALDEARVT